MDTPMISPPKNALHLRRPLDHQQHLVDVSHDSSISSILGINCSAQQKDETARCRSFPLPVKHGNILSSLDWVQEKLDITWKPCFVAIQIWECSIYTIHVFFFSYSSRSTISDFSCERYEVCDTNWSCRRWFTQSHRWLSRKQSSSSGRGVNGSTRFDQQWFAQQTYYQDRDISGISMVFMMGHNEIQTTLYIYITII